MKICLISEKKTPADSRVALTPKQCAALIKEGYDITVLRSEHRCFGDREYEELGVPLTDQADHADILLGVKEVPVPELLSDKIYFMFSHTIKKQSYNRDLLKAALAKNITLIDYETLTNEKGERVIAFGHFAGMVGAHNGIWTWCKRTGTCQLPRMYQTKDYEEVKKSYRALQLPPVKIVLTGKGRVAGGAAQVLRDMAIKEVEPDEFLTENFNYPVFTQIGPLEYAALSDGKQFELNDFFRHPEKFISAFNPYAKRSDIFINGIYWDPSAPAFFTLEDMASSEFNIQVIADITCDIAPESSIPSTLKATTIADPVFGFDPDTGQECAPYSTESIDVMSIDNLPNELPRDASRAFGQQFIDNVLPELKSFDKSEFLKRATIASHGKLTAQYEYLSDFVAGKE